MSHQSLTELEGNTVNALALSVTSFPSFASVPYCLDTVKLLSNPARLDGFGELRLAQPIKLGAAGSGIRDCELRADDLGRLGGINPGHGRS